MSNFLKTILSSCYVVIFVGFMVGTCSGAWAHAEKLSAHSIAFTVGNQMVTMHEIEERMKVTKFLVKNTLGAMADAPLKKQILQTLLDEALYRERAAQLKIIVTEKEIKKAMENVKFPYASKEISLKEAVEKFHLPQKAIENQITSELLWSKIIERDVLHKVHVSSYDVNEKIREFQQERKGDEIHLFEIFLPIVVPKEEEAVRKFAEEIYRTIKNGENFSKVAHQFSRSPSAAEGGSIGWVVENALSPLLKGHLSSLAVGEVSKPIRVEEGYYLLMIQERRPFNFQEKNITMVLKQFFISYNDPDYASQKREKIFDDLKEACATSNKKGEGNFSHLPGYIKQTLLSTTIEELQPLLQQHIISLKEKEITPFIERENGLQAVCVCEREEGKIEEGIKEKIREMLTERQIALASQQYLRNLRLRTYVDFKKIAPF